MAELLRRHTTLTGSLELSKLGSGWSHWKYQVNEYISDGEAYGRPKQKTCISSANYISLEPAERAFKTRVERMEE